MVESVSESLLEVVCEALYLEHLFWWLSRARRLLKGIPRLGPVDGPVALHPGQRRLSFCVGDELTLLDRESRMLSLEDELEEGVEGEEEEEVVVDLLEGVDEDVVEQSGCGVGAGVLTLAPKRSLYFMKGLPSLRAFTLQPWSPPSSIIFFVSASR